MNTELKCNIGEKTSLDSWDASSDVIEGAGDLPSDIAHKIYAAPWLVPWRSLQAAQPFSNILLSC